MISILQSNTPGFFYLSINIIPAILLISLFLLREKNKEPITMVLSTFVINLHNNYSFRSFDYYCRSFFSKLF